jgi:hypothetical protein
VEGGWNCRGEAAEAVSGGVERIPDIAGRGVWVAALADIIESKREANRPQDAAVLYVLEKTLEEQEKIEGRGAGGGVGGDAAGE